VPLSDSDHYATLGLDRRCTAAQIRAAYRVLARRHHPDLNPDSSEAIARTQEINAAHETLSDPARRRAYDRELESRSAQEAPARAAKIERNITQDVRLRIEDFLRGVSLDIRVHDPANPNGAETYRLEVPPETAPGTRFRLPRVAPFEEGFVDLRVRAMPGFRFKVRGFDLRCDLRIKAQRASQGGVETIVGATGAPLRVTISPRVARGEIIRLAGEGLPKPRGGRGDLLVRITYRAEVRVTRAGR
jgi:DnaJ-class molecular chaperone